MMQQDRQIQTTGSMDGVQWREWSKQAFQEARDKRKLVLLDLTASWCHWCHVMDDTTYSDPSVVRMINENFVPIRVDIDQRPDISDRYNRGGFPTTAFLSDMGEPIWGSTYISPADMGRIIDSVLKAKTSGELDEALERSRMQFLDISKASEQKAEMEAAAVDSFFEDIFSTYDVEFGGFGTQPKFPQPDVLELLLQRYALDHDPELAEAVTNTLNRMADGLYDPVEGGVFRYSVTRDWHTPHYEKMLETNIGFLRNLVHAYKALGHERFAELARGTAGYLLKNLWDSESGGFFGSQEADEEYYKLQGEARTRRRRPSVDRTAYAGWNAEASAVMVLAGTLLEERSWINAGRSALEHELKELWDPKLELVGRTQNLEVYLFADQADLFEAILANLQISSDKRLTEIADSLLRGVERGFPMVEGAHSDVMRRDDAVGELADMRKDLASNSKWAMSLGLYSAIMHRPELMDRARGIMRSFTRKEVEAHGLFASSYIRAWWALEKSPVAVEVHSSQKDPLREGMWRAVMELIDPGVAAVLVSDLKKDDRSYAIACTPSGCSEKAYDTFSLLRTLGAVWSSQV
ncbi:MAG: thioredoxin domain-containing protein, partial [Thermoplasmata archaeon]